MTNDKTTEKEGPMIINEATGEAAVIVGKTVEESGILIRTDRRGEIIDAIDLGPTGKPTRPEEPLEKPAETL